jgi:hypothetical protein
MEPKDADNVSDNSAQSDKSLSTGELDRHPHEHSRAHTGAEVGDMSALKGEIAEIRRMLVQIKWMVYVSAAGLVLLMLKHPF